MAGKQAHDLFCVKANQPTLLARCARLPWHNVPVLDRTTTVGTAASSGAPPKAVTVNHFGFPHATRLIQSPAGPMTSTPVPGGSGP